MWKKRGGWINDGGRSDGTLRYIYGLVRAGGGGGVYEIKTLRSNLAPEEGGGRFSRGAYNRASTV